MGKLQQNVSNKENDALIAQHKKNLDDKQREIDQLRRELIARSNAKELNSSFPTVEEVCTEYRSIKNQEFQSVHGRITKPLRKKHKEWNKYFVNKLSHKLLFETLLLCYEHTLAYHDRIYAQIGDILQISYDDDADVLEFLFHRYLTSNFELMRQSKEFVQMKEEKIMNECAAKYKESIFDRLGEDERDSLVNALAVFVSKCCEISWSMILQRPRLSISPNEFMPTAKVEFDEDKHSRVLGSSKRDKCVLYYVWPGIAQNNVQLDNVKVYVVQRDKDFPQNK